MEPPHQEDAQCQAMGDQDQGGVVGKAASIDVTNHVVLKDGNAIIHICTRLAIGEPA